MTAMIGRRAALVGLAAAAVPAAGKAQTVKVVATMPAADAVLSGVIHMRGWHAVLPARYSPLWNG